MRRALPKDAHWRTDRTVLCSSGAAISLQEPVLQLARPWCPRIPEGNGAQCPAPSGAAAAEMLPGSFLGYEGG